MIGLHGVVNIEKMAGLMDLVFTQQRAEFEPDPVDVAYAFGIVVEDALKLEQSYGLDLSVWRQEWARRGLSEPVSG